MTVFIGHKLVGGTELSDCCGPNLSCTNPIHFLIKRFK